MIESESNLTNILPELEREIRLRENKNWNSRSTIVLLRSTIRQIKKVIDIDEIQHPPQTEDNQMTIDFPE